VSAAHPSRSLDLNTPARKFLICHRCIDFRKLSELNQDFVSRRRHSVAVDAVAGELPRSQTIGAEPALCWQSIDGLARTASEIKDGP
jgi:hypothetical protein